LTKVAVPGAVGEVITFQGATAKNRALVAAFEQRLKKPIHVSKFCHLTGAVGVALALRDEPVFQTRFRGLGLHRNPIPVRSEVCDFCANHCKLTIADVGGTPAAYGFLCGRDYDTQQFVSNNRSGFDLLRERRKVQAGADRKFEAEKHRKEIGVIGIPAALHLFEDLDFWKYFFDALGVQTLTSEGFTGAVKAGKSLAGAEFCAPMAALHGHVRYLSDRADAVFLPVCLEKKQDDKAAQTCSNSRLGQRSDRQNPSPSQLGRDIPAAGSGQSEERRGGRPADGGKRPERAKGLGPQHRPVHSLEHHGTGVYRLCR